jgi:Cdc6-like AAA superfamily ATPase
VTLYLVSLGNQILFLFLVRLILCQENVQGISRNAIKLVSRQHDQESQAILSWLTPANYFSQQSDLIKRRQEGTGKWLLESNEFQQWQKGEKQILFCPGIPGAGKTITASIVVDHLLKLHRNDLTIGIAFLYCNFQWQQKQQPINLLSSLLEQFSRRLPSLPQCVIQLYKDHKRERTRPSLKDISTALQTVITGCSRVFIIIDALDEYQVSDRLVLLKELFEIQSKTNSHLFATSRFIPDIEDLFAKRSTRLEIQAMPEDIQRYIDGNLHKLPPFVSHNSDLLNKVKSEITQAAHGMYV